MSVGSDSGGPLAETVDEYLAAVPAEQRAALERLLTAIRAAAPDAEELIRYRIPICRFLGSLVHFATFRDHSSLIVVSRPTVERFPRPFRLFHLRHDHPVLLRPSASAGHPRGDCPGVGGRERGAGRASGMIEPAEREQRRRPQVNTSGAIITEF